METDPEAEVDQAVDLVLEAEAAQAARAASQAADQVIRESKAETGPATRAVSQAADQETRVETEIMAHLVRAAYPVPVILPAQGRLQAKPQERPPKNELRAPVP